MVGLAMRIARRMGIDTESSCAKCGALEGEMRRRLWWALVLFDTRVSQMANYSTQTLVPSWDCNVPLNVNDADLRPEMKELPAAHTQPTEAIFVVARCVIDDFIRNMPVFLDFHAPQMKPLARNIFFSSTTEGEDPVTLEDMIEEKYLRHCDPENPLHYMTIWNTRGHLAKYRLIAGYSKLSDPTIAQSEAYLSEAVSHALRLLECDTKIVSSPLTTGYRWMPRYHFPFPAYIHLTKDLKKRPLSKQADQAWEAMNENCEARFGKEFEEPDPFIRVFARLVFDAWAAREAASAQLGETPVPPLIVLKVRDAAERLALDLGNSSAIRPDQRTGSGATDVAMPMPMEFSGHVAPLSLDRCVDYGAPQLSSGDGVSGQQSLDINLNQLDWAAMDWRVGRPFW
jgi:hypothetical protein